MITPTVFLNRQAVIRMMGENLCYFFFVQVIDRSLLPPLCLSAMTSTLHLILTPLHVRLFCRSIKSLESGMIKCFMGPRGSGKLVDSASIGTRLKGSVCVAMKLHSYLIKPDFHSNQTADPTPFRTQPNVGDAAHQIKGCWVLRAWSHYD